VHDVRNKLDFYVCLFVWMDDCLMGKEVREGCMACKKKEEVGEILVS
jgi:hypothetical protein